MVIYVNNTKIKNKLNKKKITTNKITKKKIDKKIINKNFNQKQPVVKKKKFRIKFKFIIIFLLFLFSIGLCVYYIINIKVTNIYISGNSYLTDQEVIELAGIQDYPSTFRNSNSKLEKELEKNMYIKNATVNKKKFTQIFITIEENRPLFYNQLTTKTILLDGNETIDNFNVPILINNIPDVIYDEFTGKMGELNINVLNKISEIKYTPDTVDDERFLFTMTDSNYVYLTLKNLEKINSYNDIVKQFDNKKGILYLNSGGYFEIDK